MNFRVYKSSAGSGKTFTLVKEYLKIALSDAQIPPVKYRHILAITFTNKAAAEMKERIVTALKEIAGTSGKGILIKLLEDETGLDEKTLRQRAEHVLLGILHNYSDFAIGTIDSFVHRIVRTFAYDLHLPVNFEIEMDSDKLLTRVIDLLLSKAGSDADLTRALVEFTESRAEDEKSWHIEQDLFEFSKHLLTEGGILHLEKLKNIDTTAFLFIQKNLVQFIRQFETSIQKQAEEAIRLIKEQGVELRNFYRGQSGIGAWFSHLAAGKFDKLEANTYVQTTVQEGKYYAEKTSEQDKSGIDAIKDRLSGIFLSIEDIVKRQQSKYYLFKLISTNIFSLAVLNEIEKLLIEVKKQNSIVHISEFNKIISRIILNQPVPFIYERIGAKYLHYLIDEFQDTSVLQWQNLLPLIENSLAEGHANMLVGDGKQAIYRWRGGEVEQFAQLPEVFGKGDNPFLAEREQALKRNYEEKQLNKNFRSRKEIIEFNNSLFKFLSGKLPAGFQRIYNNLAQEADPANEGGYISVKFMPPGKEDMQQRMLDQVMDTITQLQSENYRLNDIAILCRTNKTGSVIAEYLTQNKIGVLSPDSLLLKSSRKVSFMESLLRNILQPGDEITRVEILQYLVESGVIPICLSELIQNRKHKQTGAFYDLLKQHGIDFNQQWLVKLPLYELAERLISLFDLGGTNHAFLQYFLDEILSYSIKNNNNLSDFLTWWSLRREKASVNAPEGANAVNIMTIHSSKGLEFPVVLLPFTGSRNNSKGKLWVDLSQGEIPALPTALLPLSKDLEKTNYALLYEEEQSKTLLDTINLLYVALTRPEERLYIINPPPSQHPENLHTVADILCHYLQSQQLWNEHQQQYEFGRKTARPDKVRKTINGVRLTTLQSNNWSSMLKIRAQAPEAGVGLIVHDILSKVRVAADLVPVINQFLGEGIIDRKGKEEIETKIRRIIENPQLAAYFREGNNIKTETEIILPDGQRFRPDRVIFSPTTTTIIDYKTGLKSDSHIKQIQNYGALLNQMGYQNIESYLVYIEDESILNIKLGINRI